MKKLSELTLEEHRQAKKSGLFWVYYPKATGVYEIDSDKDDEYVEVKCKLENGQWCAEEDLVKKPNHYQLLPEYEVKHVIKALLDKIDASDFEMSSYQCGWLQQSLQYQLRFYAKNGLEDLEKAYETLGFVIEDMKRKD